MKKHVVMAVTALVISSCLPLVACSEYLSMTSKDDQGVESVSMGSLVNLNPAEVEGLKKRFQEGDAVAAYRLYQYFAFARSKEAEGMPGCCELQRLAISMRFMRWQRHSPREKSTGKLMNGRQRPGRWGTKKPQKCWLK